MCVLYIPNFFLHFIFFFYYLDGIHPPLLVKRRKAQALVSPLISSSGDTFICGT